VHPASAITGEYIDDKALNSRVRSALGENPEFKFGDVSVASFRGVVQLSGFVNTTDQKKTAGDDCRESSRREDR
jgi:osmotically-inducible protein OsmY